MADVFISYSRRDAPYAEALAAALTARGRSAWLDTHGIEDGEVFPAALRRAIEESDGFVFVISPASAASPYCRQEVDHAVVLGKRIVPIVHRRTPDDALPPAIRERQWVQAGSLALSADGTSLAVGYAGGFAEVLDAATLRQTVAHAGALRAVRGVLFLEDGSVLTSGQDGVLRTWAPRAGEQLVRPVVQHAALAFSRDGREIVASGPRSVAYDARSGRRIRGVRGWRPGGGLLASTTSGDDRLLGWTGADETPPRWHVIDSVTGRRLGAVRYDSQTAPPGITRDGRAITVRATARGTVPSLTPLDGGRPRRLSPARIGRCGAGSPRTSAGDRRLVIVGECTSFAVWDVRSGRVLRRVRLDDRLLAQDGGISPDGATVVVATTSGGLARVDVRSGRTIQRPALRTDVGALKLSPDGRWAATVTAGGVVDLYETATLRLVRSHALAAGSWSAMAFSPDSRRLAVTDRDPRRLADPILHVWDVCDSCRDPRALLRRLDRRALRPLTEDERRLFAVDD